MNYSEWFRIDLHIHTDKSKETKESDYKGTFSIDTLKEKLKENDVKIFSLTDHNIINVDAYENYYNSYSEVEDPLLLLGIELDIKGSEEKDYHSLLIFNISDLKSVKDISAKLEQKYQDKGNPSKKKRLLTLNDIVDIFEKDDFFFIPHAGNASKNIVHANLSNLHDTQRMLILMQSALEKITKEETIKRYNEGFDKLMSTEFKEQNDIAYINFSDNHNCDKYPCTHKGDPDRGNHSFYYIKGSKSFESIRLAFIDPESRIKSTEQYETINQTNNVIEKLTIKQNNELNAAELVFSPHLNTIIGGRSSGKSLLLWLIGKKLDNLELDPKYSSSVDVEQVLLKSRNDAELKEVISLGNSYVYIQQGDIVRYFEDSKLDELASKTGKKEEYKKLRLEVTKSTTEIKKIIINLVDEYRNSHSHYATKNFVLHNATIDHILSTEYIVEFDNDSVVSLLKNNESTTRLLDETRKNLLKIKDIDILKFTPDEIIKVTELVDLLIRKIEDLNSIDKKNKIKTSFVFRVNEEIETVNNKLSQGAQQKRNAINDIEALKQSINERFCYMRKLKAISKITENHNYSIKRSLDLAGISLVIEVKQETKIVELILEGIYKSNGDKSLYINLLKLLTDNSNCYIKNVKGNDPEKLQKKIDSQLSELYKSIEDPTDYLEYQDGSKSNGKSPGYNSEQYLKIVLSNDQNKIIFIDQPEDNLGSQFISQDLVKQIRELKYKKQFFLVTHNPSIVIYGDAESVILAENNNKKISYTQLLIEEKEAQKTICDTLDGGRYIFNNRAKKYNIHRLKEMEEKI